MQHHSRSLLETLVSIPSISGNEKKIAGFMARYLRAAGFSVTLQPVGKNRWNVLAHKGHGKSLLLFGHLDTVSEKAGWKTDPYSLTPKGDTLYGLGAWDMKAGIAAMLAAVKDFVPTNSRLQLAFVVDEEEVSLGMHTLVESGWLKNTYGAIAAEPGFTYGLQGIALGRIGRSVYRVTVTTDGGHVYLVNQRSNAITEAGKLLSLLQNIPTHQNRHLGESIIFPRLIQGGAASMAIPDQVVFELESQLVPPQTTDSLLQEISSLIARAVQAGHIKAQVSIEKVARPTPFCEPYLVDRQEPFVKEVASALHTTTAQRPTYYYRRSVADENRVAALGIPVVTVGPEGGNAHEANEWVSARSLQQLTQFFSNFLQQQDAK